MEEIKRKKFYSSPARYSVCKILITREINLELKKYIERSFIHLQPDILYVNFNNQVNKFRIEEIKQKMLIYLQIILMQIINNQGNILGWDGIYKIKKSLIISRYSLYKLLIIRETFLDGINITKKAFIISIYHLCIFCM